MNLTDNELCVLIGLVNTGVDGHNPPKCVDMVFSHKSNQGAWTCDAIDLLRKLLKEAVKRGAMVLPACFDGDLAGE